MAFEKRLWQKGYRFVAGVDEVGRGPLAGPVIACAVIFPVDFFIQAVRDSKKLSASKRSELSGLLRRACHSWGIGQASPAEIDEYNIRQAAMIAMQRAVSNISGRPDFILVDGKDCPDFSIPAKAIVRGDEKSFTVAAASIIAKVFRDQMMQTFHSYYPGYAFDCNKGYGTARHVAALKELGPTPLHRRSFIQHIIYGTGVQI